MTRIYNATKVCSGVLASMAFAAVALAQTATTERTLDKPAVSKQQIKGEVTATSANSLVARMIPSGEHRLFMVRPTQKFIVDGKTLSLNQVKPGTILTADVFTTATPVEKRTTATVSGTVFWVAGNSVVLTLPSGENKQYTVKPDYKFVIDGKPATVSDLKAGQKISATKITEEPVTEFYTDAVVTGTTTK